MKESLISAVQELLRTGIIAAIPVLIDGLSAGEMNWRLVGVAAAIAVLRALDKLLHKEGVRSPLDMKFLD